MTMDRLIIIKTSGKLIIISIEIADKDYGHKTYMTDEA